MRILLSLLFLACLASSAAAHSARLGAPDARLARTELPPTDADLQRAESRATSPRQDNLEGVLGIRNGARDLIDHGDTRTNGGFGASFDGRGAKLTLRW